MSATAHRYSCDQLGACQGRVNPCAGCAEPRVSEGAASVERLHDAWRRGAIRAQQPRRSIAGDPLRLDDGIPVLTHRPERLHRVDTQADLPAGMAGVAIGHAALTQSDLDDDLEGDRYEAKPVGVDRRLRARTWRFIFGLYAFAGVSLVATVLASRHQAEIREGLRIAYRAVGLFLLGA